jgi:hypothetical protein
MNKKPLVAALAALSLAGVAFAGQAVHKQQGPQQARQNTVALQNALGGNSFINYVQHNKINNSNLWLAGYGQLTTAYNSDSLIGAQTLPGESMGDSSFTVGLPAVDVMMGYTSSHVGMFTDVNYSNMPRFADSSITMRESKDVREAYLTYTINDMFAVKAGKFNTDFGSYDPTAPLQNAVASLSAGNATGVEAVVATNGFHGSIAGVMLSDGTKTAAAGKVTNDARPNTVILNGGYDMPLQGGTVGVEGSYENNSPLTYSGTVTTKDNAYKAAWTIGAHFTNSQFNAKTSLLNTRLKNADGKTPFVWDGSVDYKLGNQNGHDMVVGGYGSFSSKAASETISSGSEWILGGKFGYAVNKYANATAYLQYADARAKGVKSNTTAMLALTVKV